MPDLAQELQHLERADAHIEKALARIAQQQRLIAELERDGHDATAARALLATMEGVLETFEAHRQAIVDAVAMARGSLPPEAP